MFFFLVKDPTNTKIPFLYTYFKKMLKLCKYLGTLYFILGYISIGSSQTRCNHRHRCSPRVFKRFITALQIDIPNNPVFLKHLTAQAGQLWTCQSVAEYTDPGIITQHRATAAQTLKWSKKHFSSQQFKKARRKVFVLYVVYNFSHSTNTHTHTSQSPTNNENYVTNCKYHMKMFVKTRCIL